MLSRSLEFLGPLTIADITAAWTALQEHALDPMKSYRSFDGKTPIAMHSLLAASLVASEPEVPAQLRYVAQHALLWHDVLEDTSCALPAELPDEIRRLVQAMTFPGGSKEEREKIWERSPFVWWLKLYDKWANLADGLGRGGWMERRGEEYTRVYLNFALELLRNVELRKAEIFPETPNTRLQVAGMLRGCAAEFGFSFSHG